MSNGDRDSCAPPKELHQTRHIKRLSRDELEYVVLSLQEFLCYDVLYHDEEIGQLVRDKEVNGADTVDLVRGLLEDVGLMPGSLLGPLVPLHGKLQDAVYADLDAAELSRLEPLTSTQMSHLQEHLDDALYHNIQEKIS
jgi:hypothetical protein